MSALSTMSKKRYYEIENELKNKFDNDEAVSQVMEVLKRVMNFDPEACRYTPELGQKTKEYRHKLRDEKGISTYITSGTKKRYETLKAARLAQAAN